MTGYDFIPFKVLMYGEPALHYPPCVLFKDFPSTGKLPTTWTEGDITFVFIKGDQFDKTNYRPLSVLLVIEKIFEKCRWWNLNQVSVSYREKHYWCSSVLHLIGDWKRGLHHGNMIGVTSMDLSKAFDSLPHKLTLAKLKAYNLGKTRLNWLQNYLELRKQRVQVNDTTSDWRYTMLGVPQWSVLGPLLFSMYINDLSSFLCKASTSNYAHDDQLYFASKNVEFRIIHSRQEPFSQTTTLH